MIYLGNGMWSDSGPSLSHGGQWRTHKYIAIKNGRYIYPDDVSSKRTTSGNVTLDDAAQTGSNVVSKNSKINWKKWNKNNITESAIEGPYAVSKVLNRLRTKTPSGDNRMPKGNNTNGANRVKKSSPEDAAMRNNIKDGNPKPIKNIKVSDNKWERQGFDPNKNVKKVGFKSQRELENNMKRVKGKDQEKSKYNRKVYDKEREDAAKEKAKKKAVDDTLEKLKKKRIYGKAVNRAKRLHDSNQPHNWNR